VLLIEIQNTTVNTNCVWLWATSNEGGNNHAAMRNTGGSAFAYQSLDRDQAFCMGPVSLNSASCAFAPAAPSNNACASAITITTNTVVVGSTIGSTRDGTATCGASSANGGDVWYKVTTQPLVGTERTLTVSTCGIRSTFDSVISFHKTFPAVNPECPGTTGTQIVSGANGCDDEGCTTGLGTNQLFYPSKQAQRVIAITAIDPSTTYLIRVAGKDSTPHPGGSKGVFTLIATQP
jgi:hypothetical protein